MKRPTYYAITWLCMCTQVEDRAELLPEMCDHHDRPNITGPVAFNSDGPSETGHTCCPPGLLNDPRTILQLGAVA